MFAIWLLIATAEPVERAALVDQLGAIARELTPQGASRVALAVHTDNNGSVTKLEPIDGSQRAPESWLTVFKRYEPYQEGTLKIEANLERTLLVPATVTVQVDGEAMDTHAAAVLFQGALAGVVNCALPTENRRNLYELNMVATTSADAEVAEAETVGGSPSLQSCANTLAKTLRLPPPYASKHLRVDFSVDSGPPRVALRVKDAQQAGQLDPKEIKKVIQGARKAVRDCHEQGLIRDPHLGGTIHVRFLVEKDGRVSTPTIETTTLNDDGIQTCVLGVMSTLVFPQPKGGVVIVDYPFVFRSAM